MLTLELEKILGSIWAGEQNPNEQCESVIVSIYEKHDRLSCGNHTGINLICIQTACRHYPKTDDRKLANGEN